ncbi:hypothetical protein BSU04_41835 [Caballeronia sordidicola]|uniref:Uncharacterized protein n=1 Tax=Caballeronia sordidicola TaxID=196367 RepID=A0A226WMP3_CABSO|nr:hypothetical protein BSU04_41835 [Caballeronia sordidicola]
MATIMIVAIFISTLVSTSPEAGATRIVPIGFGTTAQSRLN